MKICITSTGASLDSEMDPRFGRCQYFLFVDPQSLELEAVENPNIAASGGAGIQSAQLVAQKGAEAVITGQVGPNAYTTLQAAGVKILIGVIGKNREVLEKYRAGELSSYAQGPTAKAHSGMGGGRGAAMGRGTGRGMGRGFSTSPTPPSPSSPVQEELQALKEQSSKLGEQLDMISQRIGKLETVK
jgi:predicted Fe-Mo cluster-binding NifX family protein